MSSTMSILEAWKLGANAIKKTYGTQQFPPTFGEYLAESLGFDSRRSVKITLSRLLKSEVKLKNSSFVFCLSCSWTIRVSGLAPLRFNAKLTRLEMIASAPGKVQIHSVKCLSKSVSKTFQIRKWYKRMRQNEAGMVRSSACSTYSEPVSIQFKVHWCVGQRSWHRPSVKKPTSYAHHVARYCKLAWTLLWERSDLLESQMIKRILKSQVNGDLFNPTQKYWQVLLIRNDLHLDVYLYAVAWILPTAPLPPHLHSQLHLSDVAQLPSQKVEIGAKSWEQQQSKQSDQVQDHSDPLTPTKQPACLLIKRVTEIMFFAYGLTETWKSEPKGLTIPHNSQLCWGLFVSNHLQKNM